MKILIVSQYFWPENFRVNDLACELKDRGHEVTILTGLPNYPDGAIYPDYRSRPSKFNQFHGMEIVRVPVIPRGTRSNQLVMNYLSFVITGVVLGPWKLRRRAFDAIFVFQTSPITSALPALLLRRIKRAPVLMWVLDLWPDTLSAIGVVRSPKLLALVGGLVRFIYRRCDRILVQSRSFVEKVARQAGGEERIRYFPGWAEALFTQSLHEVDPAPELAAYQGKFNVLFAGNIGEAQDFPSILDAADALRDVENLQWLIVGDGRARDDVVQEIAQRSLEKKVVLLGRHPIERMPSFFRCARALLVTLKDEPIWAMTIPGKVQSYLASGVPVLAMMNGEGARVIEESGAGMTAPAGAGATLAEAVLRLMALTDAERAAMGRRGRMYCEKQFGRNMLVSSLETWMQELKES